MGLIARGPKKIVPQLVNSLQEPRLEVEGHPLVDY
jgi:hypothetical protein